ncbi:MAG: acetylglutamate kinase, partial [Chloroflexia bacterium]|nr:acetylglutamate kinase [Chloroflexia bacterium]
MDKLTIVKVGGNLIDDAKALDEFLQAFSKIEGKKLLVHGGGKLATRMSSQLGIKTEMVNGRRITDAENLKIVTMVYAGYVNKSIVAQLHAKRINAIGMAGCDFDILRAEKRKHPSIDFGYVGDITRVDEKAIAELIEQSGVPVIAPITHDGKGQLLNTNADSIVTDVAIGPYLQSELQSKAFEMASKIASKGQQAIRFALKSIKV